MKGVRELSQNFEGLVHRYLEDRANLEIETVRRKVLSLLRLYSIHQLKIDAYVSF